MAWGNGCLGLTALAGAMLVAGCTQTTQVDESVTTASLSQTKKAVAVMRVGAASPYVHQRRGAARRARRRGLPPPPGHHRHERALADRAGGGRGGARSRRVSCARLPLPDRRASRPCTTAPTAGSTARATRASSCTPARSSTSATCTSRPGGMAATPSAGRVEMEIEVTDWPLTELDRFKAKRPHIYAQMKTRLMTVTPTGAGAADRPRTAPGSRRSRPRARCSSCRPSARRRRHRQRKARRSCQAGRQLVSPRRIQLASSRSNDRHGRPPACPMSRHDRGARRDRPHRQRPSSTLIAERFGYVERAWQLKLEARQEANVPWRNQQVFDRVRARAAEKGAAARPDRGAVAADGGLVHPARGGEAARPDRGRVARLTVAAARARVRRHDLPPPSISRPCC